MGVKPQAVALPPILTFPPLGGRDNDSQAHRERLFIPLFFTSKH
ncbi:MAG: hypothetical protein HW388_154 [Dehalococcoidia bacterium]|nr:hypothetical protein [Dehalococcoidia bacterium]